MGEAKRMRDRKEPTVYTSPGGKSPKLSSLNRGAKKREPHPLPDSAHVPVRAAEPHGDWLPCEDGGPCRIIASNNLVIKESQIA
jgi:hypothetical protein